MRYSVTTESTRTEATQQRGVWLLLGTIGASQVLMLTVVARAAAGIEINPLLTVLALPALIAVAMVVGSGLPARGKRVRESGGRGLSAAQGAAASVGTRPAVAIALAGVAATVLLVG